MSAGRPPVYKTPEEFNSKVEEYFEYIQGDFTEYEDEETGETKREYIRYPEPSTITGLALFLGFESRQSFYDYEKNGEFSYTVKRSRLRIENGYEKNLSNPKMQSAGTIFALKNLGWSDKQEIDNTSSDGSMTPPTQIVFTKS